MKFLLNQINLKSLRNWTRGRLIPSVSGLFQFFTSQEQFHVLRKESRSNYSLHWTPPSLNVLSSSLNSCMSFAAEDSGLEEKQTRSRSTGVQSVWKRNSGHALAIGRSLGSRNRVQISGAFARNGFIKPEEVPARWKSASLRRGRAAKTRQRSTISNAIELTTGGISSRWLRNALYL